MDSSYAMAVLSGAGITLVYFYLFNAIINISRRLSPGPAGAVILFSYLGRLTAVGVLLFLGIQVGGLDPLVTGIAFMVSFTAMFIYTQGRAVRSLMTGRLSERKE